MLGLKLIHDSKRGPRSIQDEWHCTLSILSYLHTLDSPSAGLEGVRQYHDVASLDAVPIHVAQCEALRHLGGLYSILVQLRPPMVNIIWNWREWTQWLLGDINDVSLCNLLIFKLILMIDSWSVTCLYAKRPVMQKDIPWHDIIMTHYMSDLHLPPRPPLRYWRFPHCLGLEPNLDQSLWEE